MDTIRRSIDTIDVNIIIRNVAPPPGSQWINLQGKQIDTTKHSAGIKKENILTKPGTVDTSRKYEPEIKVKKIKNP